MKKLLAAIKRLADKIFGTRSDEFYWKFRHIFGNKEWTKEYSSEESVNHPHRKFLIAKIADFYPFKNVLEIGCATGPNLYLLAEKFPNVKFYGTDISENAIANGRKWLEEKNIKNVSLSFSKTEDLSRFSDKSIDIVFTDAFLIYIGPDKIKKMIKEIFRVANKAVIFNEWHSDNQKSFQDEHWVHNYKLLLGEFVQEEIIKITKLPEILWTERWMKFGHTVEVKL